MSSGWAGDLLTFWIREEETLKGRLVFLRIIVKFYPENVKGLLKGSPALSRKVLLLGSEEKTSYWKTHLLAES